MAAKADRAEAREQAAGRPLRVVCDLFLAHAERHVEARSFEFYKRYLQSFCDTHGNVRASELKPLHLTEWLDSHPGWKASRRHAIIAVKRCFKWAAEEGVCDRNPFLGVKKPPVGRRDRILAPAEKQEILDTIRDRQFREFVFALYETGCRPSEVARVTAEHFDEARGLWVFGQHKTRKKTGRPRVVYLTPAMVELTKALIAKHPTGPLFRGNRNHKGFTRNGIRCRFRRLREKLPHLKGVVSYTVRPTYTNEALCNGVGLLEVAELLGHSSTEMVVAHLAAGLLSVLMVRTLSSSRASTLPVSTATGSSMVRSKLPKPRSWRCHSTFSGPAGSRFPLRVSWLSAVTVISNSGSFRPGSSASA